MSVYFDEKPFSAAMSSMDKFREKKSSEDIEEKSKGTVWRPKRYWSPEEVRPPSQKIFPPLLLKMNNNQKDHSYSCPSQEEVDPVFEKNQQLSTKNPLTKEYFTQKIQSEDPTVETEYNKDNKDNKHSEDPSNHKDIKTNEATEGANQKITEDNKDISEKSSHLTPDKKIRDQYKEEEHDDYVDIMGMDETEGRKEQQEQQEYQGKEGDAQSLKPLTYRRRTFAESNPGEEQQQQQQQQKKKKKVEFTDPPKSIVSTKEEKNDTEESEEETSSQGEDEDDQSKDEDKSDVILYYNIVTTERGKGKRKVKPKDYVTATEEASSDDDDYFFGSEGEDDEESSEEGD